MTFSIITMTHEKLYSLLLPKCKPYVDPDWQKIIVHALAEKNTGSTAFSFIDKKGNKIDLEPSDYMPDFSVHSEIQQFIGYLNVVEDKKCNTIVFEMFPNGDANYEAIWDEEKHQFDRAFGEAQLKRSRQPTNNRAIESLEELKKNYELVVDVDFNQPRVLMLDVSETNIIGNFIVDCSHCLARLHIIDMKGSAIS